MAELRSNKNLSSCCFPVARSCKAEGLNSVMNGGGWKVGGRPTRTKFSRGVHAALRPSMSFNPSNLVGPKCKLLNKNKTLLIIY